MQTNSQKMAQAAYQRIMRRRPSKEFTSFAREFPTLVHSCGLAQAVVFALAKGGQQQDYVDDLAGVLQAAGHSAITGHSDLENKARHESVTGYLRLSRDALSAAVWLKRYVEAAGEASAASGGS